MALTQGTNSYVTLEESFAYFEDRIDGAEWFNLDGSAVTRALVTATKVLDALNWSGYTTASSQTLNFPRTNLWDSNRSNYLDGETIPVFIKEAQMELAFYLALNTDAITGEQVRETTRVGALTIQTVPLPKLPTQVRRLIRPYRGISGSLGRSS